MSSASDLAEDLITFDQFCALIPDGQKADLIDGVIYVASPDSKRANEINSLLDSLLRMYVSAKQLGQVYISRFAFQLSEITAPEPDLAYVSPERMQLVRDGRMDGGPDIAVEIVTRDSRDRDYIEKRRKYEGAGVGEYWIIDTIQRRAEFLRLGEDGRYSLARLEENRIFRSRVIPGFWLNVEWLISDETPDAYECLQQLLSSSGG
jgi:Uma2 family endonuclease